ncbi:MAG TPA: hypothetical protein DDW50_08695 [Firmicutes bacterium]|jgi:hypothetical protein|nr:hypothetical protein [Bacillota bacterium]
MDLFTIKIIDTNFQLNINIIVIIVLIILFFFFMLVKRRFFKLNVYEIDEAEIGIGNQKIKVKPNYNDIQIAFKLWVELSTRKIGLPIDFENDVIVEIYNSWYEFFKITRELIKEIPVSKIKGNQSTIYFVRVAIDVLNEGLRPHLTQWQARFKKWYFNKLANPEEKEHTPQEIQKTFPQYDQLIEDMKVVNQKLIEYRKILKQIALT